MVDCNNSDLGSGALAVLDAACMAELRALDPDGKAQLVRRVLATYRDSLARLAEQLRRARADAAWDHVARIVHTLKSSSASVGALALSSLCADIERRLRLDGDHAGAQPLLESFLAEAGRVDAAVARELDHLETADS
jgi:HPt (histidine-containing phosphotransfer) domain-containing protein